MPCHSRVNRLIRRFVSAMVSGIQSGISRWNRMGSGRCGREGGGCVGVAPSRTRSTCPFPGVDSEGPWWSSKT